MAFKNIDELARGIAASGQSWSDADKALAQKNIDYGNSIYTLKNDWANAAKRGDTTAAQDIHDRTEDFRKRYGGYSGGADGSEYIKDGTYFNYDDPHAGTLDDLAAQLVNYDKFKNPYQDQLDDIAGKLGNYGAFTNPYKQQTDDLVNKYVGRDPFSYDLDSDPVWRQYQKTYLREGQRAREDAIGNYAGVTGGQASTAAMTAASQAQDYYNAQMADKVPELYKLAYDMWLNEGSEYANQLNTLRGLGSDALNEWNANRGLLNDQLSAYRQLGSDALTAWDANRGLLNDQLSGIQGLSDTGYNRAYNKWSADYGVGRDSISDTRYEDETSYNRQQDALDREDARKKQALAQALEWMQLGLTPSDEVTGTAGLSSEDVAKYVNAVQAQMLGTGSGRSSGGGRSSSGSGGSSEASDGSLYASLASAGATDYGTAYEQLRQAGYNTTDANRYANYFAETYYPKKKGTNDALALASSINSTVGQKWSAASAQKPSASTMDNYAKKVLSANGNSADKLYDTLRVQGYSDSEIDSVFQRLGL